MKIVSIFFLSLLPILTQGQIRSLDTSIYTSIVVLKVGIVSANATINDSTTFIAKKGQLMLYWSNTHTAFIADGRFGYIPQEKIKRITTPYFKFDFSKKNFNYDKENELYRAVSKIGLDLNDIIKRIKSKENKALFQFFKLQIGLDGAAAEIFMYDFWTVINLWADNELLGFIQTLNEGDKKDFCVLLLDTSYCNPYDYYKLYYPLTLGQLKIVNK